VEKDPRGVDTPISVAIDLEFLRKSENPLEKSSAEIISMLQDIRSIVSEIGSVSRRPRVDPRMAEDLVISLVRLGSELDLPKGEEPSRERFEYVRHSLYRAMRMLEMFLVESGLPPTMVKDMWRPVRSK
jgi:hypothetical protein